jgi:FkbM family methyltransferase
LKDVRALRVSYAQNWEDVRLARVFPGGSGTYLDVGAFEPVFHSVTKLFYERGWRGVNVEPQPPIFARLAAERPGDVNLNVGLADRADVLTFYETPGWPGLSSFHPSVPYEARKRGVEVIERTIPVVTLAEVCDRHVGAGRAVEFLKVDAEGYERAVLEGGDWSRWRPRVVLVEASYPDDCGPFLEAAGYGFAVFDGINRFFVRDEDRGLIPALAAPASALDGAIPFPFLRLIEEKADLGPNVVALARRLRRLAARYPRAAALARRLLRTAG